MDYADAIAAVRHNLAPDVAEAIERENTKLREALGAADMAIGAGQSCRSEAEFTRWMHDSQRYRPHADLLAGK